MYVRRCYISIFYGIIKEGFLVDTNKKKNLLQTMTRLAIGTVLGRKGSYGLGENPAWSQKVTFIIGLIFYKSCDLHCTYMVL